MGIWLHALIGGRHPEALGCQPAGAGDATAAVRRRAQDTDGAHGPGCAGRSAAWPPAPVRAPRAASAVPPHGGEHLWHYRARKLHLMINIKTVQHCSLVHQ